MALDGTDIDLGREPTTETELDQGEVERLDEIRTYGLSSDEIASIEDLTASELRPGETANADVAAEEGLTWVPPIDPPVVADADDPEGIAMAAGFGVSAVDESDAPEGDWTLLAGDDEISERVQDALRADSMTSALVDDVRVLAVGGRIVLRGYVEDLGDSDEIVVVVERVPGVDEVIDELEIRAMDEHPGVG